MTENATQKIPVWYWIVAVLALLWNGLGVMAYVGRAIMTDEMIAALPEEQQAEFLVEYPAWYTAAFALAVFCGFLGAVSLLIKKKWAYILFIISAIAAIVQHGYIFANVEVKSYVMPILVIVVCIALVFLAKSAIEKHWIK
ncbi:hypothetical protein [uncultured Lacinutrix sp.]|uniref:hypothetical protein n=1 Tax=uncultured Lacinutrix sp. TaxID=574032 RepID=UPI00262E0CBA|nr:hypothetical protein [uncultured Lacinutrix sp.]